VSALSLDRHAGDGQRALSLAAKVRGMMPSKPLEIWRAYYRASLRDMREDDFYASALLGGMEMLKNGATTVLDHFAGSAACRFMGAGAAIQAMRDLGLRHVAALTVTDKNYEDTIPLGQTDVNLNDEIKRMSASEAKLRKLSSTSAKNSSGISRRRNYNRCPGLRCSAARTRCSGCMNFRAKKPAATYSLAETKHSRRRGYDLRPFVAAASRYWASSVKISCLIRFGSGRDIESSPSAAPPVHNPQQSAPSAKAGCRTPLPA
jgi:hypothetical protein